MREEVNQDSGISTPPSKTMSLVKLQENSWRLMFSVLCPSFCPPVKDDREDTMVEGIPAKEEDRH